MVEQEGERLINGLGLDHVVVVKDEHKGTTWFVLGDFSDIVYECGENRLNRLWVERFDAR